VNILYAAANTTCGHTQQNRLIQLTNEVLGAVADEIHRSEPLYAYRTGTEIDLARGTTWAACCSW